MGFVYVFVFFVFCLPVAECGIRGGDNGAERLVGHEAHVNGDADDRGTDGWGRKAEEVRHGGRAHGQRVLAVELRQQVVASAAAADLIAVR